MFCCELAVCHVSWKWHQEHINFTIRFLNSPNSLSQSEGGLPGAPLPSSHLYNLSNVSTIHCIPPRCWFLFVAKKDKTVQPCIDFCGLNNITIKNKYPLQLMRSTFELAHGAIIFYQAGPLKFHFMCIRQDEKQSVVFQASVNGMLRDFLKPFLFTLKFWFFIFFQRALRSQWFTYGRCSPASLRTDMQTPSILRMIIQLGRLAPGPEDPCSEEWPVPDTRKELQCFLGFTNFYCCFIRL